MSVIKGFMSESENLACLKDLALRNTSVPLKLGRY